MIRLKRRDSSRRMARAYQLMLQPVLWGGWDLVREWGRIGSPGRVRCDACVTEEEATAAMTQMAQLKRRRGYL